LSALSADRGLQQESARVASGAKTRSNAFKLLYLLDVIIARADLQARESSSELRQRMGRRSTSKYIPWAELLRKTFGFEIVCQKCHNQLRLIALIKTESVAQRILKAMACQRRFLSFNPRAVHAHHQATRAAAMTG
jgi:hypothetical protein